MSDWSRDSFFQYPRFLTPTTAGQVELPIFYFDASYLFAWYFVEFERAARLISSDRLDLVPFAGKALAAIFFFEYRETSIGPYMEAGAGIAVTPKGAAAPKLPPLSLLRPVDKNLVGFEIIDLPVTTQAAFTAGRDIWSFPKFVTDIAFSQNGNDLSASVRNPNGGGDIVSLSGKAGPGIKAPVADFVLYSRHHDQLLRINVNTRGAGRVWLPGTIRAWVANGEHPMAKHLNELGLSGRKPAMITTAEPFQSRLNQGAAI